MFLYTNLPKKTPIAIIFIAIFKGVIRKADKMQTTSKHSIHFFLKSDLALLKILIIQTPVFKKSIILKKYYTTLAD